MVRPFITVFCGLLLAGCSVDRPWRNYEIIVDVPTPHGVVKGSGVISARTRDYRGVEGSFAISLVRGEAIPIRLDDGRLLFMTMGRGGGMWAVLAPWVEDGNLPALASGRTVPMNRRLYPQFAMFKDIRNPGTGYRVMAEEPDGIGPGYGPVSISIRETDKVRDVGITRMMPWVLNLPANLRGGTKCGSSTPNNDPCMNAMDFNMDGFGRGR